jgi:hypothetical protein
MLALYNGERHFVNVNPNLFQETYSYICTYVKTVKNSESSNSDGNDTGSMIRNTPHADFL